DGETQDALAADYGVSRQRLPCPPATSVVAVVVTATPEERLQSTAPTGVTGRACRRERLVFRNATDRGA
ncbi:MAG TPA: hypothetical protein PK867_27290, partial [Pirellulales bacterium]|nr:hypothetical protein [Pirellulales bacterium]